MGTRIYTVGVNIFIIDLFQNFIEKLPMILINKLIDSEFANDHYLYTCIIIIQLCEYNINFLPV